MPSEIAVPFRVGADGRVVTTSDPDEQVRQHVVALINTSPTQRACVPGYGVRVTPLMFENMDGDDVAVQLRTEVSRAMQEHEPGVALISAEVGDDTGENLASVDIRYARRDAADSGTAANANTAIIGANGVVREVVRG
jgi:phage baseplate assembly protein W